MSVTPQEWIFGALTLGMAFSAWAACGCARWCGMGLAGTWVAQFVCENLAPNGVAPVVGVWLDLIAGSGCFILWAIKCPKWWVFALGLSFIGELAAHFAFDSGPPTLDRQWATYYALTATYAAQLVIVGVGPWGSQLVRSLRDCLAAPDMRRGMGGLASRTKE